MAYNNYSDYLMPFQLVYQPIQTTEQRFQSIVKTYEIGTFYSEKIKQLAGFEIVLICDDSGSMSSLVKGNHLEMTRWEELKRTTSMVIDIASLMDVNGIDVYFLNRNPVYHVKSSSEVAYAFEKLPEGFTPTTRILSQILEDKQNIIGEQKLLILIATDGLPTDDYGNSQLKQLEQILKHGRNPIDQIYVTFLMCTDDQTTINKYNKWDKKIINVDVVDDYASEREEVLKTLGKKTTFSFGDYVVKCLIGSMDQMIDQQDERHRCIIC